MKIAFKSLILYKENRNCDFICFGIFLSILAKFDWICKKFHRQVTTIQFDDN